MSEIVYFNALPVGARFRFEHDPDLVWTKTDRREYARETVKRIGSVLAPVIPEPFEVRSMNDTVARYYNDPAFHTVVDTLRLIIRSATLSPSEVREAAMTACVIEEMHRPAAPLTCSPAELEKIRASWSTPPPAPIEVRENLVICETCQLRVPERLATFGVGVRGGTAARCAACLTPPGPDGERKRLEVIDLRRARSSELAGRPGSRDVPSTPTFGADHDAKREDRR
jgi:hypothetical protein